MRPISLQHSLVHHAPVRGHASCAPVPYRPLRTRVVSAALSNEEYAKELAKQKKMEYQLAKSKEKLAVEKANESAMTQTVVPKQLETTLDKPTMQIFCYQLARPHTGNKNALAARLCDAAPNVTLGQWTDAAAKSNLMPVLKKEMPAGPEVPPAGMSAKQLGAEKKKVQLMMECGQKGILYSTRMKKEELAALLLASERPPSV